jgi:hypothetical protein
VCSQPVRAPRYGEATTVRAPVVRSPALLTTRPGRPHGHLITFQPLPASAILLLVVVPLAAAALHLTRDDQAGTDTDEQEPAPLQ